MTTVDRRQGLNAAASVKVPCRIATTSNITLSGLQTIDGVTTVANDRVLVKDQTDQSENGIYVASTSTWQRDLDWDGSFDIKQGTSVRINAGTVNAGQWFSVATADPITVGTTNVTLESSQDLVDLATQLASTTSTSVGDALVAVKRTFTGAVAETQHDVNERTIIYLAQAGAVGDNATDDYADIQAALDAVSADGGGWVYGERGKTYRCTVAPIIPANVYFDGQGSKLHLAVTGNQADQATQYGLRLRSHTRLRNVWVDFDAIGADFGSQAGIGSAINIGALQGDAGTVASPGDDASITDVTIENVIVSTNLDGRCGLIILGDVNHVTIDNINVPSSSTILSALQIELNYLGSLNSLTPAANLVAFNAGTAYTTHPRNIHVRNLECGVLSKAYGGEDVGSHAVRLICPGPNIVIDNVYAAATTYATIRHTTNGMGYEYCPADLKRIMGHNIKINNVSCFNTGEHWLINHDGYANQEDLIGYTPLRDTLFPVGVVYDGIIGSQQDSATGSEAVVRIQNTRGCVLRNFSLQHGYNGIRLDSLAQHVLIEDGEVFANRVDGILVSHSTDYPEDVVIRRVQAFSNNTSSSGAGIMLDGCNRVTVQDCTFGRKFRSETAESYTESVQVRGLRVTTSCTGIKALNNYVSGVISGGLAYQIGDSTTDYHVIDVFDGNLCNGNIKATERYSGVDMLPFASTFSPAHSLNVRHFRASGTSAPTAGTWTAGDTIYYAPAASTAAGACCVTSGTFSAFSDTTGDTDGSTSVITGMTSTSGLSVGDFVSVSAGFSTTGPYRVLAITSTTITIDANSDSVQSNITVSTPDPVFKTMAALSA